MVEAHSRYSLVIGNTQCFVDVGCLPQYPQDKLEVMGIKRRENLEHVIGEQILVFCIFFERRIVETLIDGDASPVAKQNGSMEILLDLLPFMDCVGQGSALRGGEWLAYGHPYQSSGLETRAYHICLYPFKAAWMSV